MKDFLFCSMCCFVCCNTYRLTNLACVVILLCRFLYMYYNPIFLNVINEVLRDILQHNSIVAERNLRAS
jgi:hypothetical protein